MRHLMHAALVILAAVPWLISRSFYWLSTRLVIAADWVDPDSDYGNCHSFVVLMRRKRGGYTCERPAARATMFGLQFPHVLWIEALPAGTVLRQTDPVRRKKGWIGGLASFYFRFRVVTTEPPPKPARHP